MSGDDIKRQVQEIIKNHKLATGLIATSARTSELFQIYNVLQQFLSKIDYRLYSQEGLVESWMSDCVDEGDEFPFFYSTCEEENAVDYLEVGSFILRMSSNHKWKWLTIALHGALYSLAISSLGRFHPELIVNKSKKHDKEILISFRIALKLLQDPSATTPYPCNLDLSISELKSIEELSTAYRNEFVHFIPKGLSISISDMVYNCLNSLRPILVVAYDMGGLFQFRRQVRAYWALRDIIGLLVIEYSRVESQRALHFLKDKGRETKEHAPIKGIRWHYYP